MKPLLTYLYVLKILTVITFHHSLASPIPADTQTNTTTEFTTLAASTDVGSLLLPKKPEDNPPATTTEKFLPSKVTPLKGARNIQLELPHEGTLVPEPSHDNFEGSPVYQQPISSIAAVKSYPATFEADVYVPIPSHFAPVAVAYPLDVDGGDMAFAESNIVFRPLFSYRQSTSEKKRVYYYQPSLVPRSSRGRYPDYYNNAPFDNVS